jgi:hypothetical protein
VLSELRLEVFTVGYQPVGDLALSEAREDRHRPRSVGLAVGSAQGHSYGYHISFGHHGLEARPHVGEGLVRV